MINRLDCDVHLFKKNRIKKKKKKKKINVRKKKKVI